MHLIALLDSPADSVRQPGKIMLRLTMTRPHVPELASLVRNSRDDIQCSPPRIKRFPQFLATAVFTGSTCPDCPLTHLLARPVPVITNTRDKSSPSPLATPKPRRGPPPPRLTTVSTRHPRTLQDGSTTALVQLVVHAYGLATMRVLNRRPCNATLSR